MDGFLSSKAYNVGGDTRSVRPTPEVYTMVAKQAREEARGSVSTRPVGM